MNRLFCWLDVLKNDELEGGGDVMLNSKAFKSLDNHALITMPRGNALISER